MSDMTTSDSRATATYQASAEQVEVETSQDFIENAACPICDSSSYTVIRPAQYPANLTRELLHSMYHSSGDHELMDQLVSCSGCGLVYLNPRVSQSIALSSYTNAVDPRFVEQNDGRIRTFSRTFTKLARDYSITRSKETRVLDVGCAGGAFVKAAQDLGTSAMGVEPSAWMCQYGREKYGLDLRQGTLQDFKLESESFDVITLWDVLEHVYAPVEVLRECQRLLKPGGLLIVNYPDYNSLARRILRWKWPFFLSVHVFYFTPKTIRALLTKCELTTLAVTPFFQTLELGYVIQRATPYFPFLKLLGRIVAALGIKALPCTYNMGQSMVVARKDARN